jgi:hypothetical protein
MISVTVKKWSGTQKKFTSINHWFSKTENDLRADGISGGTQVLCGFLSGGQNRVIGLSNRQCLRK